MLDAGAVVVLSGAIVALFFAVRATTVGCRIPGHGGVPDVSHCGTRVHAAHAVSNGWGAM